MDAVNHGKLLILSGPAGSGKTTLAEEATAAFSQLKRVVTATTRQPRAGEVDGRDYHFYEVATFEEKIAHGAFYESALVHGRYYGTPKSSVTEPLKAGVDLLLVIDVQGADAFRKAADEDAWLAERLHTIFLMPANLDQLRERLKGRGSDDVKEIERRMDTAKQELEQADCFDHRITTTSKAADFAAFEALYRKLK